MSRTFDAKPAVRSHVPLWIGLFGPSGGGKTFSALRLATGIARETGGEIFVVDTESRRALAYADRFRFRHIDFSAPFSSTDYLAAVRYCLQSGGKTGHGDRPGAQPGGDVPAPVVIIDSASHEHEGEGGYLKTQEAEIARLSRGDQAKAERVKMLSWALPARMRQEMINGLLQLDANIIWCFRAKEKVKPVKRDGKSVIEEQGWQPIAGPNLLFEMTMNCLLLPRADGVPTWDSEHDAERAMMKLPVQFRELMLKRAALSEDIGAQLARWARGDAPAKTRQDAPAVQSAAYLTADNALAAAAERGSEALKAVWSGLTAELRSQLKQRLDLVHKPDAAKKDEAA